jgi:hypothetical protein
MIAAMSVVGATALAAEEDQRDFSTNLCKDVMRMSGAERDLSLAFAHGYVLGKKGTTKFDIRALQEITDQFISYCLDHPQENALKTFERIANK